MTRKHFLSTGAAAGLPMPQATGGRPKNVLFLMSDQHKPQAMSMLGHAYAKTPHIDALAADSVRFDNAYCTNPVCTPSRASILTGLYTHRHRTYTNATPWPFEIKTMAHHFSRAGYMSGLIGKMHFVDAQTHGFDYRISFNDWYQYLGPKTKLYAEELSRANSGSGMPEIDDLWADFGDPWQNSRDNDNRRGFVHVGRPSKIEERDHQESFVSREAIRFLKRFGKQQPFFLIASYLKPHDPFMPAERFARMFPPDSVKVPATWGKVDLNRVPKEIRSRIEQDRPTPELKDEAAARTRIAMYYASLAQMDDCLGQVVKALKELDLDKDTIIVYTSDHGDMLGEHGLWGKFVFYEPSVGVPFTVRVPGVPPAVCHAPVSQTSLMSTLLELSGIAGPAGLDGESLAPFVREPTRAQTKPVFSQFAVKSGNAKQMIRLGDWKYMHYLKDTPELYNLRADPQEMNNLAGSAANRDKEQELHARSTEWHRPS